MMHRKAVSFDCVQGTAAPLPTERSHQVAMAGSPDSKSGDKAESPTDPLSAEGVSAEPAAPIEHGSTAELIVTSSAVEDFSSMGAEVKDDTSNSDTGDSFIDVRRSSKSIPAFDGKEGFEDTGKATTHRPSSKVQPFSEADMGDDLIADVDRTRHARVAPISASVGSSRPSRIAHDTRRPSHARRPTNARRSIVQSFLGGLKGEDDGDEDDEDLLGIWSDESATVPLESPAKQATPRRSLFAQVISGRRPTAMRRPTALRLARRLSLFKKVQKVLPVLRAIRAQKSRSLRELDEENLQLALEELAASLQTRDVREVDEIVRIWCAENRGIITPQKVLLALLHELKWLTDDAAYFVAKDVVGMTGLMLLDYASDVRD